MSRGGWRPVAALGLVALLALGIAGWLIQAATRSQTLIEQEAAQKADAYAQRARITIERHCPRLAHKDQRQCVEEAAESARRGEHDERDLEAQLVTSVWTHYMGLAAIGGTAFGIIGIFLVLATFRENKRAADAAHEANRPWAEAVPEDLAFGWTSVDGGELTLVAKMVNHGNSPATNVVIRVLLAVVPRAQEDTSTPIVDLLTAELESVENRKVRGGKALFPGEPDLQKRVAIVAPEDIAAARVTPDESLRFLFAIGVTYCFGGRKGRTVKTYILSIREDIDWDAPSSNFVTGDKLWLTDRFIGYAT